MAQVLVRSVPDEVVERLKQRAARNARSLEAELRCVLENAARLDRAEFRRRAGEIRSQLKGRYHSDSTALIREDRDR